MIRKAQALAAFLVLAADPSAAQSIDFDRLGKLCRVTATHSPSTLARRIADGAMEEHALFAGHEVDSSGRILRFGNVEVEGEFGEHKNDVPVGKIPWRHVLRYWETLSGQSAAKGDAAGALRLTYYNDILAAGPNGAVDRGSIGLQTLLRAVERLDLSELGENAERAREALRTSVVRTSLVDTAWSAAFVSSVLKRADVPGDRFRYSAGHIAYISEAIEAALAESTGGTSQNLYRACDPYNVRPRVGDMICYHRHAPGTPYPYKATAGMTLFRSLVSDIAAGSPPIWRSHCDIVTQIDVPTKKVRVIGGNVQQAVTVKVLNINQSNLLSTNQGTGKCEAYISGKTPDKPNCNLNAQQWFVLLQNRGD